TRFSRDWSSDVCSSDLLAAALVRHAGRGRGPGAEAGEGAVRADPVAGRARSPVERAVLRDAPPRQRARAVRWPAGAVRSAAGAASAGGGLASEGCPIAAPARNRSEAGSTAETALPALRVLRRAGPPRAGAVRIRSATWAGASPGRRRCPRGPRGSGWWRP